MSSNPHHAHVYTTFEQYRERFTDDDRGLRFARKRWNQHIERNGSVPLIVKCAICSGEELKQDIKKGRYTPARPSKVLRDEQNVLPDKDINE